MCRYAYKIYKPHFVCFACRKQFRKPSLHDIMRREGRSEELKRLLMSYASPTERAQLEARFGTSIAQLRADHHELVCRCPECGARMANLGLDFKPPRRRDVQAWEAAEAAHRRGHHWQTCGCDGPGFVPSSRRELREYLAGLSAIR